MSELRTLELHFMLVVDSLLPGLSELELSRCRSAVDILRADFYLILYGGPAADEHVHVL